MKQIKKYLFTICCFLLTVFCLKAQINLVKNPSFEQYTICPTTEHQIYSANFWNGINNILNDTNECAPDYYNTCANPIGGDYFGVPGVGVYLNYQYPRSGNAYVDIVLNQYQVGADWVERAYAKGSLTQTLIAGKTYCFNMWANLSNLSKYQCNNMMAYFDDGSIDTAKCGYPIAITPQIINTPNVAITDTLHWVLVSGSFVANGTENTVTIGNFSNNAQSQISVFNTNGFWNETALYLIDDVSLIPINLVAYAGHDTTIAQNDSAYIGRTNEVGLNDDCTWYVLGNTTAIDTVAGLWVKPSATTTYVLEQNICGTVTYDTVKVSVNGIGIKQFETNNMQALIYPNPAKEILNIECTNNAEISITDILGNTVRQQKTVTKKTTIDVSSLTEGIYFTIVKTSKGILTKKVVITK